MISGKKIKMHVDRTSTDKAMVRDPWHDTVSLSPLISLHAPLPSSFSVLPILVMLLVLAVPLPSCQLIALFGTSAVTVEQHAGRTTSDDEHLRSTRSYSAPASASSEQDRNREQLRRFLNQV